VHITVIRFPTETPAVVPLAAAGCPQTVPIGGDLTIVGSLDSQRQPRTAKDNLGSHLQYSHRDRRRRQSHLARQFALSPRASSRVAVRGVQGMRTRPPCAGSASVQRIIRSVHRPHECEAGRVGGLLKAPFLSYTCRRVFRYLRTCWMLPWGLGIQIWGARLGASKLSRRTLCAAERIRGF
jgi:hypothetical protein